MFGRGCRFAALALITVTLMGGAGCNTVEGFGEDLQALGGAMSSKAGNGDDTADPEE